MTAARWRSRLYELWSYFAIAKALTKVLGRPSKVSRPEGDPMQLSVTAGFTIEWSDGTSLTYNPEYFQKEESQKILVDLAGHHPEEVMQSVGAMMLDEESGIQFFVGHYRGLFSALPLPVVSKWLLNAGVAGARKLARHLPPPYVDSAGKPIVPKLTELVLEEFEDDDRTFAEFCAGTYSSGLLVGNFASQFESEGEIAKRFLSHPLRRVRQWAAERVESTKRHAAQWRQFQEERDLD